jgi:1-acyl-sn-glycerol-3-phosphate acyltransferase
VILYRLIYPWLPATIRTVYRMEVRGAEHVPPRGGLVVAANHLSALDPFVLNAAVPRPLRFMAKAELWSHRPLAWAMDALGGFPVGRGRGDVEAVATGVRLLEQGEAVVLFPAGRVRTDGPWHRGAAKMALRAGVPILPVRLFDTDRALAGRRVRFPPLRVAVGPPIPVARATPTIAAARELTERVRVAVVSLPDPAGAGAGQAHSR